MSNFPPENASPVKVAPGMTFPVEAGQEYTLKDDKGEALVLEGRDDPIVIEFLHAFDSYMLVKNTSGLGDENAILVSAWANVIEKFENLPERIFRELPSVRAGGIVLPSGHIHEPSA